jgi:hypothetical protein
LSARRRGDSTPDPFIASATVAIGKLVDRAGVLVDARLGTLDALGFTSAALGLKMCGQPGA